MQPPLRVSRRMTVPRSADTHTIYHFLPHNPDPSYYWERVDRNIGWITREEQELLRSSVIGISGCGGMGGMLAERFIRLGVGEVRIADPEVFDASNINRQFGASRSAIGKQKAVETARLLRNISDDTLLKVYPQGIVEEVVDDFLEGCDVVCDEIEFWAIGARILLHNRARKHRIPVFNSNTIGFGLRLFFFPAHHPYTMEDLLGMNERTAFMLEQKVRNKTATPHEVRTVMEAVIRGLVPEEPHYDRDGSIMANVRKRLFTEGKASILASNPAMATGFLADRVVIHLLQGSATQRTIVDTPPMPSYLYFDAALMESKIVHGSWA